MRDGCVAVGRYLLWFLMGVVCDGGGVNEIRCVMKEGPLSDVEMKAWRRYDGLDAIELEGNPR